MYLYAIKDLHSGLIKLGYSSHPRDRLRELQTGSSSPLHLVYYESCSSSRAGLLERQLHRDLSHLRVRGEWFCLSDSEARNYICHCIIRYSDDPLV
jgi:Meiotically up-regulated gene 113